jgi:SAM-dependent methyltransferase
MPEDRFGESVAARYDDSAHEMFDAVIIERTVAILANLARGGSALELGIGTGRIALPLHMAGVPVHGIDLSPAMIKRLKAKPGGDRIDVTVGDFATAIAPGTYRLAYLVYNTIMNLTTQAEQVVCFRNVARHLEPGGRFVIEVGVPDLQRLPRGEIYRPFTVSPRKLGFDEYDVVNQGVISHHFAFEEGKARTISHPFRYVWPSELDLMAQLAGMTLVARWGDWDRQPFTSDSEKHVSIWQKQVAD